jgi:cyclohexanone monooxygenase
MRESGYEQVQPTPAAEADWTTHVYDMASRMLFSRVDSWFTGRNTNLENRTIRTALIYAGGAPRYNQMCQEEADAGYKSMEFA